MVTGLYGIIKSAPMVAGRSGSSGGEALEYETASGNKGERAEAHSESEACSGRSGIAGAVRIDTGKRWSSSGKKAAADVLAAP